MSLEPGSTLGVYKVLSAMGAGGPSMALAADHP